MVFSALTTLPITDTKCCVWCVMRTVPPTLTGRRSLWPAPGAPKRTAGRRGAGSCRADSHPPPMASGQTGERSHLKTAAREGVDR